MGGVNQNKEPVPAEEYMTRKTVLTRPGPALSQEYHQSMPNGTDSAGSFKSGKKKQISIPSASKRTLISLRIS